MPRPPVKRSRLNDRYQSAKRVTNNPLSSSPASRRRQLQDKLAHKDVGQVPSDSDDSDRLVVKSRNPRNRRGVPRQEIYGSGGVAHGDEVAAHKSPSNKRQRFSPKDVSLPGPRLNGTRKNAPLRSSGLKPINRLSTAQAGQFARSKVPASVEPTPSGPKLSDLSRAQSQETPLAETSVLGPIKIRKRQPSILRLISSPEDSILDQDLDDFLPDDESTPLHASRKRKLSPSPALPIESRQKEDLPETDGDDIADDAPDLPAAPSSTKPTNGQPLPEIDSDIMAPPRSSSTDPSPAKREGPSPSRNKASARKVKQPKSLSTTALQALMPARRQRRTQRDRAAKAASEFDIPEDLSDPSNGYAEDLTATADPDAEESYVARPRPTKRTKKASQPSKLQKKNPPTTLRRPDSKPAEGEKDGRGGARGKSSKSSKPSTHPSLSPAPALPKTKTTRATRAAKTSQQQTPSDTIDIAKRSSRRPTTTTTTTATTKNGIEAAPHTEREEDQDGEMQEQEGEEDKENRPSASSAAFSEPGLAQRKPHTSSEKPLRRSDPASSSSANEDIIEEEEELSIEIPRSYTKARKQPGTGGRDDGGGTEVSDPALRNEQARLARKFREVDEWEMEFEDVTFDSGLGEVDGRGLAR